MVAMRFNGRTPWLITAPLSALIISALIFTLVWHGGFHSDKNRARSEIHMIDIIRIGIETNLATGGVMPTNWASLSNMTDFRLVSEICLKYRLPPITDSYILLKDPVFFNDFRRTGEVFLVRASIGSDSSQKGRWALVRGNMLGDGYGFTGKTNAIFRVWLRESELSTNIRAQLPR
jgi:hypothetical protein